MRILVITNDSTVFLSDEDKAGAIFGGRVTEVRGFCESLRKDNDVTFKIITGRYGLVDSDDMIKRYNKITDSKEKYEELQRTTGFSEAIRTSGSFDLTVVFVPKDIFRILIREDALQGNVMASTSFEFEMLFKERGWHHFQRKGARIGKSNAKEMLRMISFSCS